MAYYTFTKEQYKAMPSAQSSSLGIKKASDGTYYTTNTAATKFGGKQVSTKPGSSSSSSSSSSSTPKTTSSSTPAPAPTGTTTTSVGQETVQQTVDRAKAMLGDAYDPNTPAPTAARLDEIANQDFVTPENKAAYETTKLQPVNQNYLNATTLPKTTVPTTAAAISSPYQTYIPPTATVGMGDISSAMAGVNGLSSMADYSRNFYEKQLAAQQKQQEKQKSMFQQLMDSMTSPEEARQNAQEETGINPADFFARQERQFKEIESLQNEYNKTVEAKDQQIAMTHDKLASNNFINNQIAQIERNAAPKLNRLSADINAKAAVLEAQQGNFAEAQKYVNQAVQDATAMNKYNYDMYTAAYEMNKDNFDRLDTIYTNAYKDQMAFAEAAYNEQKAEKEAIGELLLKYPNAGIDIYGDSYMDALGKAQKDASYQSTLGGGESLTADMKNYQYAVQTGYTGSFADWLGKGNGEGSKVEGLAIALFNGQIGIGDVPTGDRNAVLILYNQMKELEAQQVETTTGTTGTSVGAFTPVYRDASGNLVPKTKVTAPASTASTPAYSYYSNTQPKPAATSTPVWGVPSTQDAFYSTLGW